MKEETTHPPRFDLAVDEGTSETGTIEVHLQFEAITEGIFNTDRSSFAFAWDSGWPFCSQWFS